MPSVRRFPLLLAVCAVAAGPALASETPVQSVEKTLKAEMVKSFKKQTPKLVFSTVTCVLSKNGTTAQCKASFTDSGVKGYYPVSATIKSGKLNWTAESPKCLYNKKTYTAC